MSTDRPATTDPADLIAREVATSIIAAQLTRSWADRIDAARRARRIVDTLDRAGFALAAKPSPLLPPRPMTDEEAAEFKRRWSATVAPRASEPVRGDGGPTPDVGAVRGGEGGSAAESEPRGIVGPGYDAVWTYIRTHPGDAYRNAAIWRAVEAFRDAVIPAIRAQVADGIEAATEARVRAQIAAQIEAVFVLARRDQSPAEAKADAYRTAAAIARGDQ